MSRFLALLALVCSIALPARAQSQTVGAWFVSQDPSSPGLIAGSFNDSNDGLVEVCDSRSGSCEWVLVLTIACEVGVSYPVLINSDDSAVPATVKCEGAYRGSIYKYSFTSFDDIDRLVKSATKIGFAFPMRDGKFLAIRFDLTGATAALAEMRAEALKKFSTAKPVTTDQVL